MNILSIQSHVAVSHVGNSAAVFALQRLGHEVWPIHTVNFSNHTDYGDWGGPMLSAQEVTDIIDGIERRGAFEHIDIIISGYLGSSDIGQAIVDAVARIKKVNPDAVYACDPVIGNHILGRYVSEDIPPLLRHKAVPISDIISPNQFELQWLTGKKVDTLDNALSAIKTIQATGPKVVLVTSVRPLEGEKDAIEMIASDGEDSWIVTTPTLPSKVTGTGDVATAIFAARYTETHNAADALAHTASSVFDLLRTTIEATPGVNELQLVQSQEYFAHPRMQFDVTAV